MFYIFNVNIRYIIFITFVKLVIGYRKHIGIVLAFSDCLVASITCFRTVRCLTLEPVNKGEVIIL